MGKSKSVKSSKSDRRDRSQKSVTPVKPADHDQIVKTRADGLRFRLAEAVEKHNRYVQEHGRTWLVEGRR